MGPRQPPTTAVTAIDEAMARSPGRHRLGEQTTDIGSTRAVKIELPDAEDIMQIEVTTDHNIDGTDARNREIIAGVEGALSRFSDRLTRVEVHLADESAGKESGDHMRCTLEARPASQQPVAVTNHAATTDGALVGALDKLEHLLARHFDRLKDHKGGDTVRGPEPS